jgi:hypothetical protein
MSRPRFVVRIEGRDPGGNPIHGTGFLVSDAGHVATCLHVVRGIKDLRVSLPYSEPWPYRVVEEADDSDLAIIKGLVPPSAPTPYATLSTIPLERLRGASFVFYGESAKEHYASAQERRCNFTGFSEKHGLIGLDGNINPGDSGGPIVDDVGAIVGVIRLRDRDRSGQAMAIPVERLTELLRSALAGIRKRAQGESAGNILSVLRRISRARFERVLLQLAISQDSMPGYAAGHDRRAEYVAQLVAGGELAIDQVMKAIGDVQASAGVGPMILEWCWSRLARVSRKLYEVLAARGVVREPVERRGIEDYHADLAMRMKRDNAVQLVEQDVVEEPHETGAFAADVPRGTAVRRIRHLLRLLSGISRGGDQSSAQLASLSRQSKVVRDAVATLIDSERPVILLGEPGSGKSMTLREVARETVLRSCRGPRPPVVVFARLAKYNTFDGTDAGDIVEFIRLQIPKKFQAVRDGLPVLIAEHRLIVLFDGMDEMERDRYSLRVQALSRFASDHEDSVRTLFSCRINDFTPDFAHHQLVLLPFGETQVADFVRRNVHMPRAIDGRVYRRHTELVRELRGRPGLAELINNPLMLFLTCQYIYAEQRWPITRAGLFGSYLEQHLQRMALESRITFQEHEPQTLLDGCSQIAIGFLKKNRGETSVAEAVAAGGAYIERVIDVGKRAGVLQSDADDDSRIRFAHHRFQEYFAARYMARVGGEDGIDWSRSLDLPAWQETLLNLASMRPQCLALAVLDASLRLPAEKLASEQSVDTSPIEDFEDTLYAALKESDVTWPLDPYEERLWADRSVLASQIVREAAAQRTALPGGFAHTFHQSLRILANVGRPTSQVKMLWAWKNAPGTNVAVALAEPLSSSIGWVRDQAIILVASISHTDVSRNLGIDLSIDFASENVLRRLATYLRAARSSGRRWIALTAWTACCQVLLWALAIAASAAMSTLAVDELSPYRELSFLSTGLAHGILAASILALVPFFVRLRPIGLARSLIASAYVLSAAWAFSWTSIRLGFAGIVSLWKTADTLNDLSDLPLPYRWVAFVVWGFLVVPVVAEILYWVAAFAFLVPLQFVTTSQTRRTATRLIWQSPAEQVMHAIFESILPDKPVRIRAIAVYAAGLVILLLLRPWLIKIGIGRLIELIFHSFFYVIVVVVIIATFASLVLAAIDRDRPRRVRIPVAIFLLLLISASSAWFFVPSTRQFLRALWLSLVAFFVTWIVPTAICLLVIVILSLIARAYSPFLIAAVRRARPTDDPEVWVREMKTSDPVIQLRLLQFDRSRFHPHALTASEYLDLLIQVERFVVKEPAADVYWRKRQQLEQAVRHETSGSGDETTVL